MSRPCPELSISQAENFWKGYDEGVRDVCETVRHGALLNLPLDQARVLTGIMDHVQKTLTGVYQRTKEAL
jgi:hypothetical protein